MIQAWRNVWRHSGWIGRGALLLAAVLAVVVLVRGVMIGAEDPGMIPAMVMLLLAAGLWVWRADVQTSKLFALERRVTELERRIGRP